MKIIKYSDTLKNYVQNPFNQEMINKIKYYKKVENVMSDCCSVLFFLIGIVCVYFIFQSDHDLYRALINSFLAGTALIILCEVFRFTLTHFFIYKENKVIIDGKEFDWNFNEEELKQDEFDESLLKYSENANILKETLDKVQRKPYNFEIILLKEEIRKDLIKK